LQGSHVTFPFRTSGATVDGRNPGDVKKTLVNHGRNYQPQLVSRISSIKQYFSALLRLKESPTQVLTSRRNFLDAIDAKKWLVPSWAETQGEE